MCPSAPKKPELSDKVKDFINRVKAFIRQHRQLITVVGAIVIFFTFVTKEIFRDELKDSVDSFSKAEMTLSIGTSITKVRESIRESRNTLDAELHDLPQYHRKDLPVGVRARGALYSLEEMMDQIFTIREANERAADLLPRLPKDSKSTHDIADIKDRLDAVLKQLWPIRLSLYRAVGATDEHGHSVSQAQAPMDPEEALKRLLNLDPTLLKIETDSELVNRGIAEELRRQKEILEGRYSIAKELSWVLFGIGWGLALIAARESPEA